MAIGCRDRGKKGKEAAETAGQADPALPGVAHPSRELDRDLRSRLTDAERADNPAHVNRLATARSPYLRQHATNPINWYPWGDEAFERARRDDKPIFLSIGYSSCYWCHVMERESFENEEVARVLNEHFVSIKLDREEHPDIDRIYLRAVQLLSGDSGWPMNIFMTADREPFIGSTYLSRDELLGALDRVRELHRTDRGGLDARKVLDEVREASKPLAAKAVPGPDVLESGAHALAAAFFPRSGGFGDGSRFPFVPPLDFLLRYHRRTGDPQALHIVTHTLERMAAGGIFDHLGGGFHRYTTDEEWRVPHFEKMLYDSALLASIYLDASVVTERADLAETARRSLDFMLAEMRAPGGGFYAALDAESRDGDGEQVEGYFYTWTREELDAAAGRELAPVLASWLSVGSGVEVEGRSVLYLSRTVEEVARDSGRPADRARADLERGLGALRAARAGRARPFRDPKIVTAWNGLAISALARGATVLEDPDYLEAATAAAAYLLEHAAAEGGLSHSVVDGRPLGAGVLEDYAYLIQGLLDLYDASQDIQWLRHATRLQSEQDAGYLDDKAGGYFAARRGDSDMSRLKPVQDASEPSGNGVALHNLVRLGEITGDSAYRERAERAFAAFGGSLAGDGANMTKMLSALDDYHDGSLEIVLVAPSARSQLAALEGAVRSAYQPNRALFAFADAERGSFEAAAPMIEGKGPIRARSTAYVCERGWCALPTSDPATLTKQLRQATNPLYRDRAPEPLPSPE